MYVYVPICEYIYPFIVGFISVAWIGSVCANSGEIECLFNDNHQKGKMMIMIMKTSGSQVDSPVAEGKRKEGGGRKIRDLHRDT